jgi:hypothetical protein
LVLDSDGLHRGCKWLNNTDSPKNIIVEDGMLQLLRVKKFFKVRTSWTNSQQRINLKKKHILEARILAILEMMHH